MRALILAMALSAGATPVLAAQFTVISTDFANGSTMSIAQVCERDKGGSHSPALSWSGEPAGTKSFAVTMYDPDAPTGSGFWHWSVFNIPATVHQLPAGAGDSGSQSMPGGAVQGRNDASVQHYSGPCPPIGDPPHHYRITVYAVKVDKLPLDANASGARVGFQLHFKTLATTQIVGLYGRAQ